MSSNHRNNPAFWLVIFAFFAILLYLLRSILLPFVLGGLVGYLFTPLVNKFTKLKINRTTASCLVLLLIVIIALPALLALCYFAEVQINNFIATTPLYIDSLTSKISSLLSTLQESFPALSKQSIMEYLQNNLSQTTKFIGKILQKIISGSFAFFNILSLLLITPVVAFYMLRDWPSLIHHIDELIPKSAKKDVRSQARAVDEIISSFIRGQTSVCLLLGSFYALGLSIIGLDLGLLVGLIAGIISFIPYVGSITGFILSLALAVAQFNSISPIIAVVMVFVTGQFLEGNFLTPKLVGDSVRLHPLWIMFALLAGGVLLGFLGLMIAVPLAAVIGVLTRYAITRYKQSSIYKN